MRLSFWAVLIALGMIFFGGSGVVEHFSAGEKKTITIEELIEGGPATGWYEITGAEWNELETLFQERENTGRIQSDGMLVMVRPEGTDPMAPTSVLLKQRSSEIASLITRSQGLNATIAVAENYLATQEAQGAQVDPARIQSAIEASEELDALFAQYQRTGTIEGLVSKSAPGTWTRGEIISTGAGSVDTNFVVIDPNYEPDGVWKDAGLLGGGLLLLVLLGFYFFGGRSPKYEDQSGDSANWER